MKGQIMYLQATILQISCKEKLELLFFIEFVVEQNHEQGSNQKLSFIPVILSLSSSFLSLRDGKKQSKQSSSIFVIWRYILSGLSKNRRDISFNECNSRNTSTQISGRQLGKQLETFYLLQPPFARVILKNNF